MNMKINTHGLKMTGLRKVAGQSKWLRGYYNPNYLQLNYDRSTGEVWADEHYSLGHNSWTQYHDSDTITVCNICTQQTMQEIADAIKDKLDYIDMMAK